MSRRATRSRSVKDQDTEEQSFASSSSSSSFMSTTSTTSTTTTTGRVSMGNGAQVQAMHDDQKNLHDINKALKNYIQFMRMDENKQISMADTANHAAEIKRIREAFAEQLERSIESIAKAQDDLQTAEDALNEANRDRADLRQQLDLAQKRLKQDADARDRLANELANARANLAREEAAHATLQRVAGQDARSLDQLRAEHRDLQAESNALLEEKQALELKLQMALKDLADERTKNDAQVTYLEERIRGLEQETTNQGDTTLHPDVLRELMNETRAASNSDQSELLEQLQREYEVKIESYRVALEASGHNLQEETARNRTLLKQIQAAGEAAQEQEREMDALRARIDELVGEMDEMNNKFMKDKEDWNRIIFEKNAHIRDLKESFDAKVREFENLMGIKVALALELDIYRRHLEAEEVRLGITGQALSSNPASPSATAAYGMATPTRGPRPSFGGMTGTRTQSGVVATSSSSSSESSSSGWFNWFSPRSSKVVAAAPTITVTNADAMTTEQPVQQEAQPTDAGPSLGQKRTRSTSRAVAEEIKAEQPAAQSAAAEETQDEDQQASNASRRPRTRRSVAPPAPTQEEEPQPRRRTTRSTSRQSAVAQELEEAAAKTKSSSKRTRKSLANTAIAEGEDDVEAVAAAAAAAEAAQNSETERSGETAGDEPPSLMISGRDSDGQYVTIRNGLAKDFRLGGWSLKTGETAFEFPTGMVIPARDKLTIRLAANDAEAEANNERDADAGVLWFTEQFWNEEAGDRCALITPQGVVKATVDIKRRNDGSCTLA